MHDAVESHQWAEDGTDPPDGLDLAIVVLNYNTSDLLYDCLRSVYAGAGNLAFHVCVVDNASLDDSAAMVRREFPQAKLFANDRNVGYAAGNNLALAWYGLLGKSALPEGALPRYVLLLNPDTLMPRAALADMMAFMDSHPAAGAAGPRVRRPDGSLDRACRRSFPTPSVSLYRLTGLSRLFPKSRRFNAYNLEYLPEDGVHQVDSVVGAFMMVRGEVVSQVGALDEAFFMYGEDLDWAKRIKDAGWQVWYNGEVEITHVKQAASQATIKSRVDFYEAMWIFYRKHYRQRTSWLVDKLIRAGIAGKGGLDIAGHLWRYGGENGGARPAKRTADGGAPVSTLANDAPEM